MILVGLLVAVALSPLVLRRLALRRPRRADAVVVAGENLTWVWLIVTGALAMLMATVIFAAQSVNGYDGDAGPVLATLFDVGLYGGPLVIAAGVLLCLLQEDAERLGD